MKCETCRIKYKYCDCFLEYINFKDDLKEYRCWCCDKNDKKKFDENLKKQFFNTYNICNNDISKFILLLQKRLYPYEYMDDGEKFSEILLPLKRFLQPPEYRRYYWCRLNALKMSLQRFWNKTFRRISWFACSKQYIIFSRLFENFWNVLKYDFDLACFLTAPRLAWPAALKKTKVKLDLLTDFNMLLMVEKDISGGICHAIHRYAKPSNKYMKDYDKRNIYFSGKSKLHEDSKYYRV